MADNQTSKQNKLPCPANLLVPHRSPMLLINTLILREGKRAMAKSAPLPLDSFKDPRGIILPEYFIEIIAQTMAAANGYDAMVNESSVKNGFITEVSSFMQQSKTLDTSVFEIEVEEMMSLGSLKVMKGEVFADGDLLASGELKIYQDDQELEKPPS